MSPRKPWRRFNGPLGVSRNIFRVKRHLMSTRHSRPLLWSYPGQTREHCFLQLAGLTQNYSSWSETQSCFTSAKVVSFDLIHLWNHHRSKNCNEVGHSLQEFFFCFTTTGFVQNATKRRRRNERTKNQVIEACGQAFAFRKELYQGMTFHSCDIFSGLDIYSIFKGIIFFSEKKVGRAK